MKPDDFVFRLRWDLLDSNGGIMVRQGGFYAVSRRVEDAYKKLLQVEPEAKNMTYESLGTVALIRGALGL